MGNLLKNLCFEPFEIIRSPRVWLWHKSNRGPQSLSELHRPSDKRHHAEFFEEETGLGDQLNDTMPILSLPADCQHAGVVEIRTPELRLRPDRRRCGNCSLEVGFGFLPPAVQRRRNA